MSAGSPGPGASWNTTLWRSPPPPLTPALHRSSKAPLSCPEALGRENCCFPTCFPSMRLTPPLGRRGFLLRALGKPSRWLFSCFGALLVGRGPGAAPRGPVSAAQLSFTNEAGEWDAAGRGQPDPGQRAVWLHPGVFGWERAAFSDAPGQQGPQEQTRDEEQGPVMGRGVGGK